MGDAENLGTGTETPEAPPAEVAEQKFVEGQEEQAPQPEGEQQEGQEEQPRKEESVPLAKYMETRREYRALKARLAEMERRQMDSSGGKREEPSVPDESLTSILAGLRSTDERKQAEALAKLVGMASEKSRSEFELNQRKSNYETFSKESEAWFLARPEAKNDPEFGYNIMEIINANPSAKDAVFKGQMSPDQFRRFIMTEYNVMMNPETEESKIKDAESSRSARRGAGSPQGGGSPRGKRQWTPEELKKMSPEDYEKNRDAIEKFLEEAEAEM